MELPAMKYGEKKNLIWIVFMVLQKSLVKVLMVFQIITQKGSGTWALHGNNSSVYWKIRTPI